VTILQNVVIGNATSIGLEPGGFYL
jgi:hypothetical protein